MRKVGQLRTLPAHSDTAAIVGQPSRLPQRASRPRTPTRAGRPRRQARRLLHYAGSNPAAVSGCAPGSTTGRIGLGKRLISRLSGARMIGSLLQPELVEL